MEALMLRVAKETLPRRRIRGSRITLRLSISRPLIGVFGREFVPFSLAEVGMALQDVVWSCSAIKLVPSVGEEFLIVTRTPAECLR